MAIDQLAPPWTSPASPRPLVAYRVRTLNPAGRSTAPSPAAFVLAGPPLPVIAGFHAQQTKEGVVLEWPKAFHPLGQETVVEILRTEPISASTTLSPPDTAPAGAKPPPKPAFKGLSRSQPNDTSADVHLRQGSSPLLSSQPGQHGTKELDGMIDRSALQGKVYLYSAQRVQVVPSGAKKMEIRSEPTPPTTVVMRDTFPPAPPKGLVSVPGTTAGQSGQAGTVDLAWEPNTEPDLAGYFVYRTDLTEGTSDAEPTQLNASPIPASTYRDGSVLPRHRYVYRVAAVDRNGNVSALSSPEDAPEVR